MQLDNFEKQVQQKLSNREIKPSENSWDRLDAMLSVEEKPKKKGFFWINIAASLVIFASIGYYFYNPNTIVEPLKEEPIIVEDNSEFRIQNSENNQENIDVLKEKQETRNKKQEVLVENDNLFNKSKNQSTINNQQSLIVNQGVSIINQSPEKAIALEKQTSTYKYTSPEKLLAEINNANFEIKNSNAKEIKNTKKNISVNPNTLLSNAETELNQTYRETALEKLNRNFNSVKTVLVNRNYE